MYKLTNAINLRQKKKVGQREGKGRKCPCEESSIANKLLHADIPGGSKHILSDFSDSNVGGDIYTLQVLICSYINISSGSLGGVPYEGAAYV